jgi:SAM-dependent methyltransferase
LVSLLFYSLYDAVSQVDRERWNRKYAAIAPNPDMEPDPLLLRFADLLDGQGMALDLACGLGSNAMFLARRGYEVIGVDASLVGLCHARAALAGTGLPVQLVAADLDDFVLPRERFALAIVFRFLNRSLLPGIKRALKPGGLLIYQTFNVNQLHVAPAMRREYLLEPGELARLCGDDLDVIATNDTADITGPQSYWIGRRPG